MATGPVEKPQATMVVNGSWSWLARQLEANLVHIRYGTVRHQQLDSRSGILALPHVIHGAQLLVSFRILAFSKVTLSPERLCVCF